MAEIPTVFCLASGRSGTHFLYEILRRNTLGVICRHEPYLWNPSMFGRPIYDHAVGDEAAVRKMAERKRRVIDGYSRAAAYAETSHAFLKSWADLAVEFFPKMKVVHLVRNPLSVAKSEAIREDLIHRWRLPLRNYHGGDGKPHFRWSLTGLEPIFDHFQEKKLSRLQWYVIQWIEIENRAMQFLQKHNKQRDCFTVHSPVELNDMAKVESLLEFLELPRRGKEVHLKGRKNRTPGVKTEITERDRAEFADVAGLLPTSYLEIFRQQPYSQWEWAKTLQLNPPATPPAP
ncbi:MAG: hypothetical protein ACR2FY_10620 [Pirellulaceae bacterium]